MSAIKALLASEQLPDDFGTMVDRVCAPLAERIGSLARSRTACTTIGLCGAQGSGKSTITRVLQILLEAQGFSVAALSIDDFYLTRTARLQLAKTVHPLLSTRGVPGTHDLALASDVLSSLRAGRPTLLPRFDKALDDRSPREHWQRVETPAQLIILEGWCVGAMPQPPHELATPINALEREHDAQGIWRRYVNTALAGEYRQLFTTIDWLIMLEAPDFEVVHAWRNEQEEKLRQRVLRQGGDTSQLLNEHEVRHFIAHYERLTRAILHEMPARAEARVRLDAHRQMRDILIRN